MLGSAVLGTDLLRREAPRHPWVPGWPACAWVRCTLRRRARNKWPPAQPNQPCCRAHLNAGIDPAAGVRHISVNSWETGGAALSPGSDPHLRKAGRGSDKVDGKAIREGKCRRLPAGAHKVLQPLAVTHTICQPAAATRQPAQLHHAAHQHVGSCVGSFQEERAPAVPLAGILS